MVIHTDIDVFTVGDGKAENIHVSMYDASMMIRGVWGNANLSKKAKLILNSAHFHNCN